MPVVDVHIVFSQTCLCCAAPILKVQTAVPIARSRAKRAQEGATGEKVAGEDPEDCSRTQCKVTRASSRKAISRRSDRGTSECSRVCFGAAYCKVLSRGVCGAQSTMLANSVDGCGSAICFPPLFFFHFRFLHVQFLQANPYAPSTSFSELLAPFPHSSGLCTGGRLLGSGTRPPPPPPPCPPGPLSCQASTATGHTYGGAEGARKLFFFIPLAHFVDFAPQHYPWAQP